MLKFHRQPLCLISFLIVLLCGSAGFPAVALAAPESGSGTALEADQAFALSAQVIPNESLELSWKIAPEHYLYQDKFQVINSHNISVLRSASLPAGTIVNDPDIGEYLVYMDAVAVRIPWQPDFVGGDFLVVYQGCKKNTFCYLPVTKLVHINADSSVTVSNTEMSEFPAGSATDQIASNIADRNLFITMAVFFGFGLLLTFTPCVLPMVPLVINLIVGPKHISSRKAFILSSAYVLGMAGSYAVAGLFVGLIGATLQSWMQQPAVLICFSILLVLLALTQLDLIKIKLPHFNSRLHKWGEEQLQGSVTGAFLLGIIAALIVSPCVTAPLIGALTYIVEDGNPAVGALTLFSLGLGMGIPLILVAVLSTKILPRAGKWMQFVKYLTAIMLIGLAIWMLLRVCGMWSHGHEGGVGTGVGELPWKSVHTMPELESAVRASGGKYSLVDFYADWCVSCKHIDKEVFGNADVQQKLVNYNLIRVDLTKTSAEEKQILETLDIYAPPVILFYAPDGHELRDKRLIGEIDAADLEGALNTQIFR